VVLFPEFWDSFLVLVWGDWGYGCSFSASASSGFDLSFLGIFSPQYESSPSFFLGFWFVQQALYGVASLNAPSNIGMESGGIAYWAHAGGFCIWGNSRSSVGIIWT